MYTELKGKELNKFINMYLPEWKNDIKEVSRISYKGTKEYLVNNHYLVVVNKRYIKMIDIQDI